VVSSFSALDTMARFTSTKGRKETTAEKRQRKLSNRQAHQYVVWAWLALAAILVASFVVIFIFATRNKPEKTLNAAMVEKFTETFKEAFKDELEAQKGEGTS